jgi:hypothetical protein
MDIISMSEVNRLRFQREGRASWTDQCRQCQRPIKVRPSHWRLGWGRYCSRACAVQAYQR